MYEPEEYEPQEHDDLAAKVFVMIKEEVEAKIKETVDGLAYSNKRNGELQGEIYKLRAELRNFEIEKQKSLKDKEKEVRRELFGGFTIGDKAFYPSAKYNSIPCESCKKGKLSVTIGEEQLDVNCPKCNGNGKKSSMEYFSKEDEVGSIHFEMNDRNKWLSFYLKREDNKRGIETIFKTIEECQTYCDEKNKPKEE